MNFNALVKTISENKEAVVYALDATDLVQESLERLNAWPPATKHLGQAMMGALLLQALSDGESQDSLSLQWMTAGPFGHCYAEARNYGESRATIHHPRAEVLDYATGLGEGLLQVRRTRNNFATTSVVTAKGDVSLDLVEYLEQSEQKSCGINFSVQIDWADPQDETKGFKVTHALGYLIHILPQKTEQKMNDALVRWNRQMLTLGNISRWSLREDQITLDMLRLITGEEEPKVVMNQRVLFSCNCTEDRAARALTLLETQEKKEGSFHPEEQTEIRCEYCGKMYVIKSKVETGN
jgi:redox-regulated HSP33 family molecular chaperone